jgi:hypothetical protein
MLAMTTLDERRNKCREVSLHGIEHIAFAWYGTVDVASKSWNERLVKLRRNQEMKQPNQTCTCGLLRQECTDTFWQRIVFATPTKQE